MKDSKFSIPPKNFNYADYLVNFELFNRSIYNLNKNFDFVKAMIKDAVLILFCNYNANHSRNVSDQKFEALQNLSKQNSLVIQKS